MALIDLDLAFRLCNGPFASLLGATSPEEIRGMSVLEFLSPEEHRAATEQAERILAGHALCDVSCKILRRNGTLLPLKISVSAVPNLEGIPTWFLVAARNVSEELQVMQALAESERRYRSLFDTMHNGFVLFELLPGEGGTPDDFRILDANPAFRHLTGQKPQERSDEVLFSTFLENRLGGTTLFPHLHELFCGEKGDLARRTRLLFEQMRRVARTGKRISGETPLLGGQRCFAYTLYRPQAKQVALILEDVTERKLLEESNRQLIGQLERDASVDPLTNALNRHRFDTLLTLEMERAREHHRPLSLVMVDLDNFKEINDSLGHLEGDRILVAVSELVQRHIRSSDIFARWGGEEFAVLTPTNASDASTLAERLRREIASLDAGGGMPVFASFGITQYRWGESASEFLNRADQALYAAKRKGKNRVEYLDQSTSR